MLTAFIDDSGSDKQGPVSVLAGFVSRVARWNVFSDLWQEALDGPPKLEYFKMVEANSLKGQFKGWTPDARDKKLFELATIIRSNAMFAVRAVLWWKDLKEVQAEYPEYPQEPYDLLFHNVMPGIVGHIQGLKINEKVEFIFDEQGKTGKRAVASFGLIKQHIPPELLAFVGGEPTHKSEQEFLPLQAADMYAWQVRRYMADNVGHGLKREAYKAKPIMHFLDEIPVVNVNLHRAALKFFFRDLKARFPVVGLKPKRGRARD